MPKRSKWPVTQQEADAKAAELRNFFRCHVKYDPVHPIENALLQAAVSRWASSIEALPAAHAGDERAAQVCEEHSAAAVELLGWIPDRSGISPESRILEILETLKSQISVPDLLFLGSTEKRPGRPPEKRIPAVRAFEMRLAQPERTLQNITKDVCPCSKRPHDVYCKETLRQEIIVLKRLLKDNGLTFPLKRQGSTGVRILS